MYSRCHFGATGLSAGLQFEKHLVEHPRPTQSTDAQFLEDKNDRQLSIMNNDRCHVNGSFRSFWIINTKVTNIEVRLKYFFSVKYIFSLVQNALHLRLF